MRGVFTMCLYTCDFSIYAIFCALCFSIGSLFKNYAQKLFIFLCVCVEGRVVIMPLTYEYDDDEELIVIFTVQFPTSPSVSLHETEEV